jgi:heterodisulfide reductase subunit C
MKEKEVPQDNEGLLEGKLREVCYAVDDNGNYVTVLSTGWTPKNAALKQAWADVNDKIEETKQNVLTGKLSPLAYYMEKNIMNLKLLSQYAGIPKWKVKRHLKPGVFQKLADETLGKYAQALDITIDELKTFM